MMMRPDRKLEISLQLVDELTNLLDGNEYEKYLLRHLIPVRVELQRQLTNSQTRSKIKE